MSRFRVPVLLVAVGLLWGALSPVSAEVGIPGQPLRLSDETHTTNRFDISADSQLAVYTQIGGPAFIVPLDGGTRVEIGTTARLPKFTADSQRIVYLDGPPGGWNLFSVDAAGNDTQQLSSVVAGGSVLIDPEEKGIYLTPDSQRVVYTADEEVDGEYHLYSAPIAGGASVRLDTGLPPSTDPYAISAVISGDSQTVVFGASDGTVFGTYSVPIAGGAPVRLDPVDRIQRWRIAPDSATIVYGIDGGGVYSMPIGGGPAVALDTGIPDGYTSHLGNLGRVTADSSHVIFVAKGDGCLCEELYSVPITGGPATLLTAPLDDVENVAVEVSPDSQTIIYGVHKGDHYAIHSVPVSGGTIASLGVTTSRDNPGVLYILITPDSSRVVYRTVSGDPGDAMFSVPTGGGTAVQINKARKTELAGAFVSSDGQRVIFIEAKDAWQLAGGRGRLSAALIDGGNPAVLSGGHGVNLQAEGLEEFAVSPDGEHVLYVGFEGGANAALFQVDAGWKCDGQFATIVGTNRPDVIEGTEGDDVIVGRKGADTINGNGGNDVICGRAGTDTINGGAGDDTLLGGRRADIIHGDEGADVLYGRRGLDSLFGDGGDDMLFGNGGDDSLDGGADIDDCDGGGATDTAVNCEVTVGVP